jgi:hypothetical protein
MLSTPAFDFSTWAWASRDDGLDMAPISGVATRACGGLMVAGEAEGELGFLGIEALEIEGTT